MAINKRFKKKLKKLPIHAQGRSITDPPVVPVGPMKGKIVWPNGSMLTTMVMPRRNKKQTVIGWIVGNQVPATRSRAWVCTKLGGAFEITAEKDFKYVGTFDGYFEAREAVVEAFEELHNTTLP
jgi:hypothetical protein